MRQNKLLEYYAQYIWPIHRNFVFGKSKRCKKCIVSEHYCKLNNEICEECLLAPLLPTPVNYTNDDLDKVIKPHIGMNQYDATLMLSGGKDSACILYKIKERYPDLKLLCLTVDNGFMSPLAVKNVQHLSHKLNTDLLIISSHIERFAKNFRQAFLELNGRGSYEVIDFADGNLIFEIAEEVTRQMKIPLMIGGLSWVQLQKIFKSNEFAFEKPDVTIVHPLAVWKTNEQEIRNFVRRHELLLKGSDSPVASNHQMIAAMCALDILNNGYCSFEPEFAQLIREGKTDRKTWLFIFELLEYVTYNGWLDSDIQKVLDRLNLKLEDVVK